MQPAANARDQTVIIQTGGGTDKRIAASRVRKKRGEQQAESDKRRAATRVRQEKSSKQSQTREEQQAESDILLLSLQCSVPEYSVLTETLKSCQVKGDK